MQPNPDRTRISRALPNVPGPIASVHYARRYSANTLKAAGDLSVSRTVIYRSAHFWLTWVNPPRPCRLSHDSASSLQVSVSSAWRGQCQHDGAEVERQSGLGWDLIQVQNQRNGASVSGWAMDCEAVVSQEPRALWLQPSGVDLSLAHLMPRHKMAVISLPNFFFPLSLSSRYVNNQIRSRPAMLL